MPKEDWEKKFDKKDIVRLKNPVDGEVYIRESWAKQFIKSLIKKKRVKMGKALRKIDRFNDNRWLAKLFHNEYEGLAEKYGWKTNKKTRVEFEKLPLANLRLMLATSKLVLWNIRQTLGQAIDNYLKEE